MRISRIPLLTFLLVLGLLAATALPALAGEIKCGSRLGPGGTFVLNHDLTCPPNPNDSYEPAVIVIGAKLNLNGHTLSCGGGDGTPGRRFGIEVFNSTLRNGTVTGCWQAVRAFTSVVKRVTVSKNGWGIYMQRGDDNLIQGNTAVQNGVGFLLEDGAQRNTLINNTATGHVPGAAVLEIDVRVVLVGRIRPEQLENLELGGRGVGRILGGFLVGGQAALIRMGTSIGGSYAGYGRVGQDEGAVPGHDVAPVQSLAHKQRIGV